MNQSVLLAGLAVLEKVFGGLSDAQKAVYVQSLSEWMDDEYDWEYACKEAISQCKSFPLVTQLIDFVHGSLSDRAIFEWQDLSSLSAVGRKALAAVGGYTAVSTSERPDMLRNEFIKAYVAYGRKASRKDFLPIVAARDEAPPAAPPVTADGDADALVPVGCTIAPVQGAVNVDEVLGIKRSSRGYTRWELLLHRWWAANQFGDEGARERCRQRAAKWGRTLPPVVKIKSLGNVIPKIAV